MLVASSENLRQKQGCSVRPERRGTNRPLHDQSQRQKRQSGDWRSLARLRGLLGAEGVHYVNAGCTGCWEHGGYYSGG
jgi:Flp pilus assembly protein TadB